MSLKPSNDGNASSVAQWWLAGLALLWPLSTLALAIRHLGDLRFLDRTTGVWTALAWWVTQGVWFPPLIDPVSGSVGGTRYMPLYYWGHAGLAQLTGEFIASGKIWSLLAATMLAAAVASAVWRTTRNAAVAMALAAMLFAFDTTVLNTLSIRGDGLAAALGLAAVCCVGGTSRPGLGAIIAAALLAALAVLTKFSTLAPLGAIGLVLLWNRDRRVVLFAAVAGGTLVAGIGLLQWLTDGQFLAVFRFTGGAGAQSLSRAFMKLPSVLIRDPALLILTCLAMGMAVRDVLGRRCDVWTVYVGMSLATTMIILSDPGAELNHTLEFGAACLVLVAKELTGALPTQRIAFSAPRRWGVAALILSGIGGLYPHASYWTGCNLFRLKPHQVPFSLNASLNAVAPVRALAGQAGSLLLTDDPTLVAILDRPPAMLDPYLFLIFCRQGLVDPAPLIDKIEQRQFPLVILYRPDPDRDGVLLIGADTLAALKRNYEVTSQAGRYRVYSPRHAADSQRHDGIKPRSAGSPGTADRPETPE